MGSEPEGRGEPYGKDEPQRDEWDELVLDENFVKGAEVSEPTARTRMLSERWKHEAPSPQPWRSDEPPAGWVFSRAPGRRDKEKKPKRRRRWFRRKKGDGGGE